MMETLARFILARRYYILVGIGAITLFLGAFSLQIDLNQRPDELLYKNDPEYPRLQAFFEEFGYDEVVTAAYSADDVLSAETLQRIKKITEELIQLNGVTGVLSIGNADDVFVENGSLTLGPLVRTMPQNAQQQEALKRRIETNPLYDDLLVSKDNSLALFDITLDANLGGDERDIVLRRIDEVFSKEGNGNPHYMAGSPVGRSEGFRCMRRDFSTLLPMGMLLLILAMYLMFRNYLCVLLPFVAISLSVVCTVGIMYLAGSELNFFSVLIPTILFIIGTCDCVHILSQYQDCRQSCSTKSEAVRRTLGLMLLPCALTTLTTMLGFSSLIVCHIEALRLFGLFSAVGMGFAFLLSITLLPIGLSIGDTKPLSLRRPPSEAFLGILDRMDRFNVSNRFLMLPFFVVFFLLAGYGALSLHIETDPAKFFGRKMKIVTDTLFIEQKLGGFIPFFVVIEGNERDQLKHPELLHKMDELAGFIRKQEGVDKVISGADLIKYINFRLQDDDSSKYSIPEEPSAVAETLLMASMSGESDLIARFFDDDYSKASMAIRFRPHDFDSFKRLMDAVLPYLDREFNTAASLTAYVTGTNIMLGNAVIPSMAGLKQGLILAGIAIFVLMIAMFRSLRVGFITMLANIVPITITFGSMGLLGISLNFATAPIAAIALGIAVDDTIHFMSRFKREFSFDKDYRGAITRTMISVGKPILITSVVLTAGFFIFLLSDYQFTRNMGMLISFTVVGAIIGDLILLPVLILVTKPMGKKAI